MIPNYIEKTFGTGNFAVTLRYNTQTGSLEKKYNNKIRGDWWKTHGEGIGTKGYKMIQIQGSKKYTHRIIWEIAMGNAVPPGRMLYLKKKDGVLDPNNIYSLDPESGDQITLEDMLKAKYLRSA